MTTIRRQLRVGADGNLVVPMSPADAGAEVVVTVAPVAAGRLSPEERLAILRETAGSIADPSFRRLEQSRIDPIAALD